ncbi:MAG: TrkH family potassium uptake protein, partial [Clostridia bacterium]|nr:TrkH family potassium uptake protein [Clostridia bacterium]
MNYKMVFNTVGKVLKVEAVLMVLPIIVSLIYTEWVALTAFLITALLTLILGLLFTLLLKPKNDFLFAKEGLVTVALTWISVSLLGSLPFFISKEIPNFIDALFETVSGFTTTGASILTDVTTLSHSMLFWRSFTHWIGGMGVLVFILAITSKTTDRSIHILRAEMPGPIVDKFVPKTKDTTFILYLIYSAITLVLIVMLLCGGMPLFESIVHAFGTAGTGGFGVKADSIAGYSNYIQWVIAIFMLLFGINFNLYYLLIIGKIGGFFKSRELWIYLFVTIFGALIITSNIYSWYGNFNDAFRNSVFQTSSIITTTGYATADFTTWPALSQSILVILMFVGACAGSTAGGFKLS